MIASLSRIFSLLLVVGMIAIIGCGGGEDANTDSNGAASISESAPVPNINSIDELKTRFNADSGLRLILVLSPTCKTCLDGARYVQREIMNKLPDADLHVYAIWTTALADDTASGVDPSVLTDARVSHFWDVTGDLGRWFAEQEMYIDVKIQGPVAYDFFSLHDVDASWEEVPQPLASFGGGSANGTIMRFRGDLNRDINRLLRGETPGFVPPK